MLTCLAGIGSAQRGHIDWRYRECGLQPSATEHSVRPVPDSETACPVTSSIVRLLTHSVVGWNISFLMFLFLDISFLCLLSCGPWSFFYLGHFKNLLYNTIQYNTIHVYCIHKLNKKTPYAAQYIGLPSTDARPARRSVIEIVQR